MFLFDIFNFQAHFWVRIENFCTPLKPLTPSIMSLKFGPFGPPLQKIGVFQNWFIHLLHIPILLLLMPKASSDVLLGMPSDDQRVFGRFDFLVQILDPTQI